MIIVTHKKFLFVVCYPLIGCKESSDTIGISESSEHKYGAEIILIKLDPVLAIRGSELRALSFCRCVYCLFVCVSLSFAWTEHDL